MNPRSARSSFQILTTVLLILVLGTTIGLFFVFTDTPRSLFAITVIFFLCLIESGIGLSFLAGLAGPGEGRVSGAARAIAMGSLGLYALAGLVTIAIRAGGRSGAAGDGRFLAILFAEGVVFLVAAALVIGFDLFSAAEARPMEHDGQRRQALELVARAMAALDSFKPGNDPDGIRLDRLKKEMYALHTTLAHSPLQPRQDDGGKGYLVLGELSARLEAAGDLDAFEPFVQQLKAGVRSV
jgi:hypothetical protein